MKGWGLMLCLLLTWWPMSVEASKGKKEGEVEKVEKPPVKKKATNHPIFHIILEGLKRSPNVSLRLLGEHSRLENRSIERSTFFPKVDLLSRVTRDRQFGANNSSALSSITYGIRLRQNVLDLPAYYRYQSSKKLVSESQYRTREQIQLFIGQLCRLYLNIYRLKKILDLAKLNKGVNWDNYFATQQRYKHGELTITDMELAKTRDTVAQAVLDESHHEVKLAELRFRELTGMALPKEIIPFDIDLEHELVKGLVSGNQFRYRNDLLAIKEQVRSQEDLVRSEKLNRLPKVTVSMTADELQEWGSAKSNFDHEYTATLEVSLPVFEGFKLKARQRQEGFLLKSLRERERLLNRQVTREVEKSHAVLKVQTRLHDHFQKASKSARKMVDGFQEEYLAGTRTSSDVLDAENERFTVETRRINSVVERVLARIQVMQSLGLLDIEVLRRVIIVLNEEVAK